MNASRIASSVGRIGLAAAAAVAALSLASCGPTDLNAMNASYDAKLTSGCVQGAAGDNSITPAAAQAYCGCVTTQLDQVPIQQRVNLPTSSDQVNSAVRSCAPLLMSGAAGASNATPAPPSNAPADQSGSSSSSSEQSNASGN